MRMILAAAAFFALATSATAEVWLVREGECGEWQSRWDVTQEPSGLWVGSIDHYHVGGPCGRRTGQTLRSDVRAVIVDGHLFAIRHAGELICTHMGQIDNRRGQGITICENAPRFAFNIRFRVPPENSVRDPADDLLENEESLYRGRRLHERNLDDWIRRR
jgi:hypothetical protein